MAYNKVSLLVRKKRSISFILYTLASLHRSNQEKETLIGGLCPTVRNEWRLWCEKLFVLLLLHSLLKLWELLSCSLFWSVCRECPSVTVGDVVPIKASGGYISSRDTQSRRQSEPLRIREMASGVELKSLHWPQNFLSFPHRLWEFAYTDFQDNSFPAKSRSKLFFFIYKWVKKTKDTVALSAKFFFIFYCLFQSGISSNPLCSDSDTFLS